MWLVAPVLCWEVSSLQGGLVDSARQLRGAVDTDSGVLLRGPKKVLAAVGASPFTSWPPASPGGSQTVAI